MLFSSVSHRTQLLIGLRHVTVVWLVQEFLPIGRMNELETANMAALKKELGGSIKKGVEFANAGQ